MANGQRRSLKKTFHRIPFGMGILKNVNDWRKTARKQLTDRLSIPEMGGMPDVKVNRQYEYDSLHVENFLAVKHGNATRSDRTKARKCKGKIARYSCFP